MFAKYAAEYIVQIVPAGVHDWSKFVTTEELTDMLRECKFLYTLLQFYYHAGCFLGILDSFLGFFSVSWYMNLQLKGLKMICGHGSRWLILFMLYFSHVFM